MPQARLVRSRHIQQGKIGRPPSLLQVRKRTFGAARLRAPIGPVSGPQLLRHRPRLTATDRFTIDLHHRNDADGGRGDESFARRLGFRHGEWTFGNLDAELAAHRQQLTPRHAWQDVLVELARPQNAEVMKKVSSGEKLTREEEAIRDRYLLETGIRSIMMGWTGVAGRDGKPLKFSLENAMLVMGHMKRLWSEVQAFAFDAKNYGIVEHPAGEIPEDVDAAGNSSATSGSASEASTAS